LERRLVDAGAVAAVEHTRAIGTGIIAVVDRLDREVERIVELDLALARGLEQAAVFAKALALDLRDDLVRIGIFRDPILAMAPRAGQCDAGICVGHSQSLSFNWRRTGALRSDDPSPALLTK